MEAMMSATKILLFHPDPARSKANAALAAAAATLPDVDVIDMAARHPKGCIEQADDDIAMLLSADRLVLQFPIHWYAPPPLLKAWQDHVLTRMFYIRYPEEGRLLEGKPIMVAATAGNVPEAYTPTGPNLIPLEQLLAPLQAMAHRCGLPWGAPHLLYRANRLEAEDLREAGKAYRAHLSQWIEVTR
jgi:putative NADPH-quinone reductase